MYPLKQGLKLNAMTFEDWNMAGWSSVSIKTRIETNTLVTVIVVTLNVEVVYPLKQGLKL